MCDPWSQLSLVTLGTCCPGDLSWQVEYFCLFVVGHRINLQVWWLWRRFKKFRSVPSSSSGSQSNLDFVYPPALFNQRRKFTFFFAHSYGKYEIVAPWFSSVTSVLSWLLPSRWFETGPQDLHKWLDNMMRVTNNIAHALNGSNCLLERISPLHALQPQVSDRITAKY